jgi:arsenate reductase-like glutaredoxin family protein
VAEEIDLGKGMAPQALDALIGKRDHLQFLNTRNDLYKERGMKANPPGRDEAIQLMSEHPNLIRRPLFVQGARVVFGFDPDEVRKLL